MAINITKEQEDLIHIHQVHIHTEKKLQLLIKTLEQNHKHGFFFKLFKRKCKICTALKKIVYGE